MVRLWRGTTGQRLGGWSERLTRSWKRVEETRNYERGRLKGGSKKSCFRMRVWKLRRSAAAWTACASFCVYVSIKDASSESLEGVLGGGSRIFYLYSTFVRKNNVYGWRGREEDSCSGWNRDETTVTRMMMMKGNRTSSIKHFVCS